LIHSAADEVIPFSHGQVLRQALAKNPNAEFWFETGNIHGQLGADYQGRVKNFFLKHMRGGKAATK
jgi:hypothetical protein